MPGTRCTVAVCNNSFEKTKRAGMNIMYHQFPKSQPLRDIWIQKCRRAGRWNPNSCHICSIHFTEDDYNQDIPSELLRIRGKRRLKSTAIPSLFLTEPPPLGLMSLVQRKRKKMSVDDEAAMYLNDDESIYLQLQDGTNIRSESAENLPIYEIYEMNSNEGVIYATKYENDHIEKAGLQSYFIERQESVEDADDKYSASSRLQCISVKDCSTQTDADYFLKNYKQLVDINQNLETELEQWGNRYKKLMSNMELLESKIQRLTLNSEQLQKTQD